ncbi:MAG TPA: 2-phospho-L-lactate guanylyltransferase [Steroidobacteraceae bacterium]
MNQRPRLCTVVPVKDPAVGKARLAPLLDARQRRELCLFLAQRTLELCAQAFGAESTIVVTASPEIARLATQAGVQVVPEDAKRNDLNAAIRLGAARARLGGAGALLVVPADLALLSVEELRAAAEAIPPAPGCLIVPDRRGSGTNMLGLAPPREDLFAFGEGSLKRHSELAERAGCEVLLHRSAALALDLDLPEDYAAWRREIPENHKSERLRSESPLQH